MASRSHRYRNSSEPTLFNALPPDVERDIRAALYAGAKRPTVHQLLELSSAAVHAGSSMADRFSGFDLAPSKRLKWSGSEHDLLRLRHQIVLNRLSAGDLEERVQCVQLLEDTLGIKPLLAEVLVNRGLTNPIEAMRYLDPSLSEELARLRPFLPLCDAAKALYGAIQASEGIVLVADFDADGNCAAALLRRAIEVAGGSCQVVQPDRALEGYGMTDKVLPRILKLVPQLVITLDLGTSDRVQFETLRTMGVRTMCVDHHKPQAGNLANPDIMVNAHLDLQWKDYQDLCASGLAWMLAYALFRERWGEEPIAHKHAEALLPFAATGTVADVMQLTGLNRALVSVGNRVMVNSEIPAFQALCEALRDDRVTGEYIGFHVGPMLNACGRINAGTAEQPGTFPVSAFLDCRESERAKELASQLVRVNRERQRIERAAVDTAARDALDEQRRRGVPVHFGTVLALEDVHEGVVGLVAARTTERMQCPMIVVTRDMDGNWKGSGRSIPGIDLIEILESLKTLGLVVRGGGHPAAIGVVVTPDNLERFTEAFHQAVQERLGAIPPSDLAQVRAPIRWIKEYKPDLIMSVDDLCGLAGEVARVAHAIEPCGRSNEPIKLLLPNVLITSCAQSDAGHLRIRIEDGYNPGRNWIHQESLEALVFARSVTAELLQKPDSTQAFDLIVQPAFDRSRQSLGTSEPLSVQVLLAQPSVFQRDKRHKDDGTNSRRKKQSSVNPSSGMLFDLSINPAAPRFSSSNEFYELFGITIMTDAVEFRKEQFDFVASQIIRDREAPHTENLLYRAEVAAGKTVMALLRAAELLCRDPKAKVLYLTPQLDLADQVLRDIKAFLTLKPDEVLEFTGRASTSSDEREELLRGLARIVVGTPQTFKPFLPPPYADISRSLAAPLAQFGLVVFDEVHLMHGDNQDEHPSLYAYRAIASEVLRLQEYGVPIRLWAQSGSPADNIAKCRDLAKTLRARYEKVEVPARAKRWETSHVLLDSETRKHLGRLRDAYRATYNELLKDLPLWIRNPKLLEREDPPHTALLVAVQVFKETCRPDPGKIFPSRTAFLSSQKELRKAIVALTKYYQQNKIDSPGLYSALSRVAELRVILRYFDTLRSKGRNAFVREAARNMLRSIYPAKKASPEPFTSCHVRVCRRPEMKELLTWAMTESTPQALLREFRRVYPGDYQGYTWQERTHKSKIAPISWRNLLGFQEPPADVSVPANGGGKRKLKIPSRLDLLDERLLDELAHSARRDPKEVTLLEILNTVAPTEKVMIMIEQKFEAQLLSKRLALASIAAGWYAGRSVAKRLGMRENLEAFRAGDLKVLCSTSSGDMGHNIPQVSRVIRWVPLTSPKRNTQSAGRAGRQAGLEGVYIVLLVADDDKDMDEREMHEIALARLKAMSKV
jgi:single-stranded-DNA-specific exonuclease